MSEVSQASIDKLNTTLEKLAGGNSSPKTGPTLDIINWAKMQAGIEGVAGAALPAAFGLQRVATGTEPVAIAFKDLSGAIKAVGLEKFGGAVDYVAKAVLDNKAQMDAATKAGFATNDLFKFTREAANAGLTTEEWNKALKESGSSIAGLAGNNARSAEVFSKVSMEMRESEIGGQLQAYGVTTQELAEYTALSLTNNKKLNLADAESRNKARAAAEEMALQITETAQATGMSRDALAQQTKSAQQSADSFLVLNTLTDKQQKAFLDTQMALKPLGPAADHLQVAFQTGKWDDTAKGMYSALNAVNGSGDKLQSAQQSLMRAYQSGDATQIEAAKLQQARAVADAQAAMNSKQFAETALTSTGNVAKVSKEMVSSVEVQQSARTARANAEETGLTGDKAYEVGAEKARLEARANITGKKVDENGRPIDEKGNVVTNLKDAQADPGQVLSRGINEFNDRIKTQASGIATNFENINKQIFNTPAAIEKFNNAIAVGGDRKTTDQVVKEQKPVIDALTKITSDVVSNTQSANGVPAVPNTQQTPSGNLKPIKKNKAEGGDIAENEEYIVGEDGPEKIRLAKPGVVTPNKSINSGINLEEISKTISTTISSAGGGSTTTSRVQNEDSKKAEVELEKARTQYAADRQKLLDSIKTQLGSDATFRDITKAMRTSDAAVALEDKYKAIMDPLQKRVDEGTSIEVSKKQGVIEQTRQQVEEHTKILSTEASKKQGVIEQTRQQVEENTKILSTEASRKQEAVNKKSELANAEMAGYEKQANLAKDIIGKSVEGMGDDAITAMLPKGSAMDDFYIDMNNKLQSFSADYVNKIHENEKKKQDVVTTYSNEQVDIIKTTEQLKKNVNAEQISSKIEEAKTQMSKVLQTIDTKQITNLIQPGQLGAVAEQKKQMENMFSNIGGGSLMGDMFNPKIIDAKQAEINKAKFAEEDKTKKEADAKVADAKAKADAYGGRSEGGVKSANPPEHAATMNDLNDQLKTLNSMMLRVISNTADMASHGEKITKNTKQGRF